LSCQSLAELFKRYLRKQRKNVVDPTAVCISVFSNICSADFMPSQVAIRAKLEKQRKEKLKTKIVAAGGEGENRKPSALDRFKRPT
jgi:U3 small nucleolar RNA-associated protein 7